MKNFKILDEIKKQKNFFLGHELINNWMETIKSKTEKSIFFFKYKCEPLYAYS